jgi:predicted transcriptional regulator
MSGYKALTIKMAPDVHAELADLAEQRGISITELIKRAVALDKFCWEHRDAELLVRDGDHVKQIVMFG